eukprot:3072223-Alexandrium_andersonii.AAC.1
MGPVPLPASSSPEEISRYLVEVGAWVNNLGMILWKAGNIPTRASRGYTTDPGDLPEFWGIAPADWELKREHSVNH